MNAIKLLLLSLPAFLLGTSSLLAQSQEQSAPPARPLVNGYIAGGVALVLVGVILFLGFLSSRRGHRD